MARCGAGLGHAPAGSCAVVGSPPLRDKALFAVADASREGLGEGRTAAGELRSILGDAELGACPAPAPPGGDASWRLAERLGGRREAKMGASSSSHRGEARSSTQDACSLRRPPTDEERRSVERSADEAHPEGDERSSAAWFIESESSARTRAGGSAAYVAERETTAHSASATSRAAAASPTIPARSAISQQVRQLCASRLLSTAAPTTSASAGLLTPLEARKSPRIPSTLAAASSSLSSSSPSVTVVSPK